jgi:hypothetical protein
MTDRERQSVKESCQGCPMSGSEPCFMNPGIGLSAIASQLYNPMSGLRMILS